MDKKRGQVTLFVIIAILIVVGIVGLFLYRERAKKASVIEIENVRNYLNERVGHEIDSALLFIGLQGGYSEPPEKVLRLRYHFVPYYYYNKKAAIPSKEKIKEEIEKEIIKRIELMEVPVNFVETEKSKPEIELNEVIEINFPIKIRKDTASATIRIKHVTKLSIEKMLKASEEIVETVKVDPRAIDLTALIDIQKRYGLVVSPLIYNETTIIYRLINEETNILNLPFEFYFAVENV